MMLLEGRRGEVCSATALGALGLGVGLSDSGVDGVQAQLWGSKMAAVAPTYSALHDFPSTISLFISPREHTCRQTLDIP